MSNTVVCPKYTTIGGWARNHLGGGGGGNPQSRFSNPRRACDFRITAAFESYGVKSKSRSQYAN